MRAAIAFASASSSFGGIDMHLPFEASRLKIWRATNHLATLEGALGEYFARAPFEITEFTENGHPYRRVNIREGLPITLSAIVGDVVHNLRTSLDLLASECVRLNQQPHGDVYFPFAESETELEGQIRWRHMDRAKPEVVDLVRSFKPYIGGNLALRGIHDLDIIDKHRALVPVHAHIKLPGHGAGWGQGGGSSGTAMVPERVRLLSREERLSFTLRVMFGGRTPFAREEMVPTLHRLMQEFSVVVDAFEALCFGTVTKQLPWT